MAPPRRKRRKTKEPSQKESKNGEDRISSLPDSLLHHILSFMEMRKVVATSLLSRRWRYLWMSIPSLKFGFEGSWNPSTISIALLLYEGAKIQTLRVQSEFGDGDISHGASHVDTWIRFAVRHGVQELHLDFFAYIEGDVHQNLYKMHHCLFTCGSLQILKLKFCNLNLPTSVNLHLLKTLELCLLEITDMEIKVLTSGCPLLENLAFVDCNTWKELNIFAPNLKLKSLRVYYHWYDSGDGVVIFAPNVLSLELGGALRRSYRIRNLSSIISANIDFEDELSVNYCGEVDKLVKLLSGLSQAKTLKLSEWCVKVLSIREVLNPSSLYFHATCLELKTSYIKCHRPGMTFLLRNSHLLESLTINICDPAGSLSDLDGYHSELKERAFHKKDYWNVLDLSLPFQFLHLKTIKIYGFMGSIWSTQEECESMDIEKFIQRRKNEVELVRFFLKYFKVLDKIIINITKDGHISKYPIKSELLLNLTQRLLLLPKASPNADIVFA